MIDRLSSFKPQHTKKMQAKVVLFLVMHLCKCISVLIVICILSYSDYNSIPLSIFVDLTINVIVSGLFLIVSGKYHPRDSLCQHKSDPLNLGFGIIWYLFVLDSIFTLHHYVMHTNQYLYRTVHYVHHSSSGKLDTVKGLLSHPVDGFSVSILAIFTIVTIDPNPIQICVAYSLFSIMGVVLHSGYNVENTFWNILISPADHQRHHSCANVNFGVFFSIWDRLFGTYSNINCNDTT